MIERDGSHTTMMKIKVSTWERINKYKKYGQTFDQVLNSIINEIEVKNVKKE